jgi:hypothetical protein
VDCLNNFDVTLQLIVTLAREVPLVVLVEVAQLIQEVYRLVYLLGYLEGDVARRGAV